MQIKLGEKIRELRRRDGRCHLDIGEFAFGLNTDGQRRGEHHLRVWIEALGEPDGQTRADKCALHEPLQVEMRDELHFPDLVKAKPHRQGLALRMNVIHDKVPCNGQGTFYFCSRCLQSSRLHHVCSPPNLSAPHAAHASMQFLVVLVSYARVRSRSKKDLSTPQSMMSHGRISSRPKPRVV